MWKFFAILIFCAHAGSGQTCGCGGGSSPNIPPIGPGNCGPAPTIPHHNGLFLDTESNRYRVTCENGHQFSNGQTVGWLTCDGFKWEWADFDLSVSKSCIPICSPACVNGYCSACGVCSCNRGWTGNRCQIRDNTCSTEAFNELRYKSKNTNADCKKSTCELSCHSGLTFQNNKTTMSFTCKGDEWVSVDSTVSDYSCHKTCTNNSTGLSYSYGSKISTQCNNTCTCGTVVDGEWSCTNNLCPAKCQCRADPHCQTFDGTKFDYMGECSYHMMTVGDRLDVIAHNMPCTHNGRQVSCVAQATVNVNYLGQSISISLRNDSVASMFVNDYDKTPSLPFSLLGGYIYARREAKKIVTLTFADGLKIEWSPQHSLENRITIIAPGSYASVTKGLCGLFDGIKSNDLYTSEGFVTTDADVFGNSWRVKDICIDQPITPQPHPCELNPEAEEQALFACSYLINGTFDSCGVSGIDYHRDCVFDICAAGIEYIGLISESAYMAMADECCSAGTPVNWRGQIPGTNDSCPAGQIYSECARVDFRTCADYFSPNTLNIDAPIISDCHCPVGQAFDDNNQCVPLEDCKPKTCTRNHVMYQPGNQTTQEIAGCKCGNGAACTETCTCETGEWSCKRDLCPAKCQCRADPHCQTFDGINFDFMGECSYHMMTVGDRLDVIAHNMPCTHNGRQVSCVAQATVNVNYLGQSISIFFLNDSIASMFVNDDDKTPSLPFSLLGGYIYARREGPKKVTLTFADGLKIEWNPQHSLENKITIIAPGSYASQTKGLCGFFDGIKSNDLYTSEGFVTTDADVFGNSWRVKDICIDQPIAPQPHPCELNPEAEEQALAACSYLIDGTSFNGCSANRLNYHRDCVFDICAAGIEYIGLISESAYMAMASECCYVGTPVNWRGQIPGTNASCPAGQIYHECAKVDYPSCADYRSEVAQYFPPSPYTGCGCAEGQTLNENGQCVAFEDCKPKTCTYNNVSWQPGSKSIQDGTDCGCGENVKCTNTCTCEGSEWNCVKNPCPKVCKARADPHYETFDGTHFDYMGACSYHLFTYGNILDVVTHHAPCVWAGKQGLTCVAQATVKVNYLGQSTTIFLRNDSVASMTVNGDDKTDDLPFYLSGDYIYARREDEKVVTLNFNDGLIIKWNPVSFVDNRLIITAPYTYMHKIGGMCGTYDGDKSNDLLTAEGVTVKNTTAFGNSWRVKETCDESTNIGDIPHPCDLFPDRLDRAKQSCSYLINGPFDGCKVSPANTHSDCLYDACASDTEDKFNAVVNAAYVSLAEECCEAGTPVDWRATVPGADNSCTAGQVHRECTRLDYYSCNDYYTSSDQNVSAPIVSGCRCPEGQAVNNNGACVSVNDCEARTCSFENVRYQSGDTQFRKYSCDNGQWTGTLDGTDNCGDTNPGPKYVLMRDEVNWYEALSRCLSNGMHLVEIKSAEEKPQVTQLIENEGLNTDGGYWIGATKLGRGQYYWIHSGQNIGAYRDWGPGQPDAQADCVQLWRGQWDDSECNQRQFFICERD